MKFGVLNKSTVLNRFVHHTLQRNITRLAVITRKTNIKLGILKRGGGGLEKSLFVGKSRTWVKRNGSFPVSPHPPFKLNFEKSI